MNEKRRVAAIDYGKKRIGLALTDASGTIALPLTAVPSGMNQKEAIRSVLNTLSPYLSEIRLFLVGLPLLLNGTIGEMAKEVHQFAARLNEESKIEVKLIDERLSSRAVEKMQLEMGQKRKKRKETSDELAATLLLQTYLSNG